MKLVTVLLVCVISAFNGTTAAKVVCYYSAYAVYYEGDAKVEPKDLDPNLCTHINYAFISLKSDGSLTPRDENADITKGGYKRVAALKAQNANLKVLLSIGGGDASPQTFSNIAADPSKRAAMVGSARWYLETYNFDGIDLDWEIPEANDRLNFVSLLQDFRNDFDKNGWEVTAAVRADVTLGYDVPKITELLDHINVMTYDMYGPWSQYTGQNSPLFFSSVESEWEKANLNLDAGVSQWINAGATPDKVIAGIAFYGRSFTLADPSNNGLHAPFTGPGKPGPIRGGEGVWIYLEMCKAGGAWNCNWDDEQKVPICIDQDQWLGIDNKDSIAEKVAYIKSKGLGGAMIWSIDQDDVHGSCGDAKPLLHIIADNIL